MTAQASSKQNQRTDYKSARAGCCQCKRLSVFYQKKKRALQPSFHFQFLIF